MRNFIYKIRKLLIIIFSASLVMTSIPISSLGDSFLTPPAAIDMIDDLVGQKLKESSQDHEVRNMVTLKNGASEVKEFVTMTMISLRALLDSNPIALKHLLMKSRDLHHKISDERIINVLKLLGFISSDGRMHLSIQNVMLSAVTESDALLVNLNSPFADPPALNDDSVSSRNNDMYSLLTDQGVVVFLYELLTDSKIFDLKNYMVITRINKAAKLLGMKTNIDQPHYKLLALIEKIKKQFEQKTMFAALEDRYQEIQEIDRERLSIGKANVLKKRDLRRTGEDASESL